MNKCQKCDERGYVPGKVRGESRACVCGYAIAKQRAMFDMVPIKDLLEYAAQRIAEKSRR